jgi:hypothetical protein
MGRLFPSISLAHFFKKNLSHAKILQTFALLLWAQQALSIEIYPDQTTPIDELNVQIFKFKVTTNEFNFSISPTISLKINKSNTGIAIAGGSTIGKTVFTAHTNNMVYAAPCLPLVTPNSGFTPASAKSLSRVDANAPNGCGAESS